MQVLQTRKGSWSHEKPHPLANYQHQSSKEATKMT